MDELNAIMNALFLGAKQGLTKTAESTIGRLYVKFVDKVKGKISSKFNDEEHDLTDISVLEEKKEHLSDLLRIAGIAEDQEVCRLAQELVNELAGSQGSEVRIESVKVKGRNHVVVGAAHNTTITQNVYRKK